MSPLALPSPTESLGSGKSDVLLKGTGDSVPSGVDGLITYNSLTMNKRNWLDTFVITKIDGMSDPDIRDEREPNPQRDGETPFDSFYSGRTLVLHGYVRTYNLDKLRDMMQALKTAFLPLVEKPMVFHGRNFATTSQIWCRKIAPIAESEEQTRDDMFRRDFMITVRASMPAFVSLNRPFTTMRFGDVDTFVSDSVTKGDYDFLSGSGTLEVKSGQLVPSSTANKIFTRDDIDVQFPMPLVSMKYTPDATFTSSKIGVIFKRIDSENYLWAYIDATGVVKMGKVEEGESTEFEPLVFDTGSSPIARSSGKTYDVVFKIEDSSIIIEHGEGPPSVIAHYKLSFEDLTKFVKSVRAGNYIDITPGSKSWVYDDLSFSVAETDEEEALSIINNGNYESFPLITITGPITDPVIFNQNTGQSLVFDSGTQIESGDHWDIDIGAGTLTDGDGDNMFNNLSPSSDWPVIGAGENKLMISGSHMGAGIVEGQESVSGLSVYHHHSWF